VRRKREERQKVETHDTALSSLQGGILLRHCPPHWLDALGQYTLCAQTGAWSRPIACGRAGVRNGCQIIASLSQQGADPSVPSFMYAPVHDTMHGAHQEKPR
jgi:hypothetical protein